MAASTYLAQVQQLYIAYFGRPADPIGQAYWAGIIDAAGGNIAAVQAGFSASAESQALYGNKSTIDKVTAIYQNVFNRAPDAAGLSFWVAQIDSGKVSQAQASWTIQQNAGAGDAATVQNKLTAAQAFTAQIDTTAEIQGYQGNNAAALARTYLNTVTSDNATATAAVAAAASTLASVVAVGGATGTTYALTKSVDTLTGTSSNDVFVAGDDGGSAALSAGDSINGGAGTDTLKIFNTATVNNTANFATATISSVENVEATLGVAAQTLNVSANADVVKATLQAGFGGTVTANLKQQVGVNGAVTSATAFVFTGAAGAADTATLNLNAAAITGGLTIADIETLNIVATGANTLGNVTAVAASSLVITGAGSLNATIASTVTKSIDGSAATGNLVIDNSAAAAAVQTIKTGAGADIYTTKFADLTKDDVIDLGAGADSLRFTDATTINSAATKAQLTGVANVEQLGTVNSTLTVDGDFVTQTSFYTNGAAGALALTNVANNSTVTFGVTDVAANPTGVSTVALKLGSNTLNVNLEGSATAASVVNGVVATAGDGLTVTGSATINVKSTGTVGQADNILDLTAADNQSIVVTGAQNLTLSAKAATGTTGFSIDGSAFTGKLTVTGTVAADIIKGGSGADVIIGGAGNDTITGGAGADKFVVSNVTAGGIDWVKDFVAGTDKIITTGVATSTTAVGAVVDKGALSSVTYATLNDVLTSFAAAGTNVTAANTAYTFTYAGDNYVLVDNGTAGYAAGTDSLIKVTGITGTLTAADIIAA